MIENNNDRNSAWEEKMNNEVFTLYNELKNEYESEFEKQEFVILSH